MNVISLSSAHENCVDIGSRKIFLHSHYSDSDPGVDYRMSNTFMKNMVLMNSRPEPVQIYQHNIGGEWESGMMIYDLIKNSPCYSYMINCGEVSSMGTIITQAADYRLSMPNCTYLFHFGNSSYSGTYRQVQQATKFEVRHLNKMLDIYTERCRDGEFFIEKGYSDSKIKNYLKTKLSNVVDWYLTAEEAMYYGFIDQIIGDSFALEDIGK